MTGGVFVELYDAFAEICINYCDTMFLKILIQMTLLGQHRLALHDAVLSRGSNDIMNNPVELLRCRCPMYGYTIPLRAFLECDKVCIEIVEYIQLDLRSKFTQAFPVGKLMG